MRAIAVPVLVCALVAPGMHAADPDARRLIDSGHWKQARGCARREDAACS